MNPLSITGSSSEEDEEVNIKTSNPVIEGREEKDVEIENSDDGSDAENSEVVIVEAVPTNKTQPGAAGNDGCLSSQARFVARKPWLCFGVAFLVASALSVIGLIVGDFDVAADNAGWQSRGTLIANRHQQVILVLFNRGRLFYGGEEAWEDLTNNVQSGWESDDEVSERRLSTSDFPVETVEFESSSPYRSQTFALTETTKRSLQDNVFVGGLEGCDTSW